MPDSPDAEVADLDVDDSTPRRSPSTGRALLAGVLIAVLALGLVACGYLVYRLNHVNDEPFNPTSGAAVSPSDQDRKQATAVAEQFALRMDSVDGTKFDDYVKRVNQLLTTKAKTKNGQVFDVMEKSYAAAKVKGTGKVLVSGVADLDDDSATVLVAHDATVKTTQGDIEHHYRWNVTLAKVDGKWLVDDFEPVN